jgi:hypothetical protein
MPDLQICNWAYWDCRLMLNHDRLHAWKVKVMIISFSKLSNI